MSIPTHYFREISTILLHLLLQTKAPLDKPHQSRLYAEQSLAPSVLIVGRFIIALSWSLFFPGGVGSHGPPAPGPQQKRAAGMGAGSSQPGAAAGDFVPLPLLGLCFSIPIQRNKHFHMSPSPADTAWELCFSSWSACPHGSPHQPNLLFCHFQSP